MIPRSDEFREAFREREKQELYDALHSTYTDLIGRKCESIELPSDNISPTEHAKFCCILCQHALLHRSIYLFDASAQSLISNNNYATTLCVRGHIETTASMGHVYQRLSSLISGNTSLDEVHDWVARQVLGSRDIQQAPEPIHVMDMIRRTDRLVNNRIFDGENRNLLEDCYARLCEFAHPNFHLYSLALRVDRENGLMLIRYDEQTVREEEFDLIGDLDISNRIFVDIFDRFAACVERIGA